MNRQQIINGLRERERAYEREASGHEPGSIGWENWKERAVLMKSAADFIELCKESENKPDQV